MWREGKRESWPVKERLAGSTEIGAKLPPEK
jgi:hypothetical protein